MKPNPFSLLNHFTVPCSANGSSCPWSARSVARGIPGAQRDGQPAPACLPVGLERASVVVLEPERVVLGGVAVGDLEHASPGRARVRDPVGRFGPDHELLTR